MDTKWSSRLVLYSAVLILAAMPPAAKAFDIGRPAISAVSSYSWKTGLDGSPGAKVAAGLYLDYQPVQHLAVSIGAKYDVYAEWEVLDDGGNTIQTLEIDNTPSVELKIRYLI